MKYYEIITLKDGRECVLRGASSADTAEVLRIFRLTHEQSDFLASYPDEMTFTPESEAEYLGKKDASPDEIEIVAFIDGRAVGSAGISRIGRSVKSKHRAEFGVSVDKDFWGLGIGKALTRACVECARTAGYVQVELEVVADNTRAVSLYKSFGFREYGRNPEGFRLRSGERQELILMRLEL